MPSINKNELAESYGYSMAMLNSNSELKSIFNKAVNETWTPERFTAAVRNSQWYKKTAEPARQAQVLKKTDPATYGRQVSQSTARITQVASEIGAVASSATLKKLGESAFMLGWDDNELRVHLATYVKWTDGRMLGQAGQWATDIQKHAAEMGVGYSRTAIDNQIRSVVAGKQTIDDVLSKITETAVSAYPHLADRLHQGETMETIAEPYRQTAAQLLEMNPQTFKLTDSTMQRALSSKDAKGKPTLRTLYDFQDDLRKDARWKNTDNAKKAAAETVGGLLKNFGIIS